MFNEEFRDLNGRRKERRWNAEKKERRGEEEMGQLWRLLYRGAESLGLSAD